MSSSLRITSNRGEVLADNGRESSDTGVHLGIIVLFLATVTCATLYAFSGSTSTIERTLPEAPALFAEESRECSGSNPSHTAVIAEEQALAKSERSVFDLQDGVLAVKLFAEATACYRRSGQRSEAEYVSEVGAMFRQSMQEEYDLLRLRLSRDLAADNYAGARLQVKKLSELLKHRTESDYALALRRLSTHLSTQE